jgi:cell division protein FtsB
VRRWGSSARVALASVALAALLLLFVFPTRSLIAQRREISRARSHLAVIESENDRLAEEAARLAGPAEIERIAREQFHMVRPGERAFAVVPAPSTTETTAADTTPPTSGG